MARRQDEILATDHLFDAEIGRHQRLSSVLGCPFGRVDRQLRAVRLDPTSQLLGGVRTHTEVPGIPPDDPVDRRERQLDTHTHSRVRAP